MIAYPSLAAIRDTFPEKTMTIVCSRGVAPFAKSLDLFDRIEILDDSSFFKFGREYLYFFARTFRQFDTVVNLEVHSRLATLISLFTCARNRIGFHRHDFKKFNHVNSHSLYFGLSGSIPDYYEQIPNLLGARPIPLDILTQRYRKIFVAKEKAVDSTKRELENEPKEGDEKKTDPIERANLNTKEEIKEEIKDGIKAKKKAGTKVTTALDQADHDEAANTFVQLFGITVKRKSATLQIGMGAVCSDLAPERMLSPERWKIILERELGPLLKKDTAVTIHQYGAPSDSTFYERLNSLITSPSDSSRDNILYLKQKEGLLELSNLAGFGSIHDTTRHIMEHLDFYAGIDTSLIHIARLLGIKNASFWGPTAPHNYLRTFPNLEEKTFYLRTPCSPCVHFTKHPPCKGNNICMNHNESI